MMTLGCARVCVCVCLCCVAARAGRASTRAYARALAHAGGALESLPLHIINTTISTSLYLYSVHAAIRPRL
jgi:hypothetical protein